MSEVLRLNETLLGPRPSRGKAPQGLSDDLTVAVAGAREIFLMGRDYARRPPLLREAKERGRLRTSPPLPVRILEVRLDLLNQDDGQDLAVLRKHPFLPLPVLQRVRRMHPVWIKERRQWRKTPLPQVAVLASEPLLLRSQPKKLFS